MAVDIEKISEKLDKMVEKFSDLRAEDNKHQSKFMFLQEKRKEAEEECKSLNDELVEMGLDPENNAEETLEKEFQDLVAKYMGVVKAVEANKKTLEDVEVSLSSLES